MCRVTHRLRRNNRRFVTCPISPITHGFGRLGSDDQCYLCNASASVGPFQQMLSTKPFMRRHISDSTQTFRRFGDQRSLDICTYCVRFWHRRAKPRSRTHLKRICISGWLTPFASADGFATKHTGSECAILSTVPYRLCRQRFHEEKRPHQAPWKASKRISYLSRS